MARVHPVDMEWRRKSSPDTNADNWNCDSVIKRKTVAIVGAGVSGLGCAFHLSKDPRYDVHIIEAESTLGGHANTINIESLGNLPVDTGFMVMNDRNYPNLNGLFKELGVETIPTEMSFSVSVDDGEVEWSGTGLNGLFASRGNIISKDFYTMLRDVFKFNREAPSLLALPKDDPKTRLSMRDYLNANGYSQAFRRLYMVPLVGAIWSTDSAGVLGFDAVSLVSFMHNHQMLQILNRPHWKTPKFRSRDYVNKIALRLDAAGVKTYLNTTVTAITFLPPSNDGEDAIASSTRKRLSMVEKTGSVSCLDVDEIVFACHPYQSKKLLLSTSPLVNDSVRRNSATVEDTALSSGSSTEDFYVHNDPKIAQLIRVLDMFKYSTNEVFVHSDPALMPRQRRAWANWNYMVQQRPSSSLGTNTANEPTESPCFVTYWLNKLQHLESEVDVFVSLNPASPPAKALVHRRMTYSHPIYSLEVADAQVELTRLSGDTTGLWFCGAYLGYGFHEDGLRTGLQVAAALTGVPVPWNELVAVDCGSTAPKLPAPKSPVIVPTHLPLVPESPSRHSIPVSGSKAGGLIQLVRLFFEAVLRAFLWGPLERFCQFSVLHFLQKTIKVGRLEITLPDKSVIHFGQPRGNQVSCASILVKDSVFFVRVALEYDLGMARSYLAGEWEMIAPETGGNKTKESAAEAEGVALSSLFLLFIANREAENSGFKVGSLMTSWAGYFLNYLSLRIFKDNSLAGSRSNISAHYDLSNDLFKLFLDKGLMMYSCGLWDTTSPVSPCGNSTDDDAADESPCSIMDKEQSSFPQTSHRPYFGGTLEEAQDRKVDTLLSRLQLRTEHRLLDIGCGWGGLAIRAAEKYGCKVDGITLSKEQKRLAEERVRERGLEHLITFHLVDYRTYSLANPRAFDRIVSCEMIEAVGHNYYGSYFEAVDMLLAKDGVFVMQAITIPEARYEEVRHAADFINTIIFPGSNCPSVHALLAAMAKKSKLSLEKLDQLNLHYAETLREWRRRFHLRLDDVRSSGFDDLFIRCWRFYLCYCEAGFESQTIGLNILVFSRQGNRALEPLCDTAELVGPIAKDQKI
uniref:Amine oxidase domain-containing protein n=1 Tax=Octactis speculum TaxID=3111310 RepID=A0A7S2DZ66_9STRA|mmetsp:Transcript_56426/g.76940  ORF Transcript_56426/g.76940 Transcript_56426/m.76940 type:complete len:1081 (+) Transcript_56426:82-3324(+)|eukprot:CAMPEP_0185796876 /NCGR_PEP_ID=MMETSP1174-20130828/161308_1 /TAXON_ID=35687 /ORGANISM="Dictyocha speculum, Strain CCMP1381" /LENGTH=1080 /DNA_ID=CAMNT_0028492269 /DNA_START=78 /DNA_END=3320 /DNA_ORIENTATION=+